jgi:Uma2 family endonuclease
VVAVAKPRERTLVPEQRLVVHGVTWAQYVALRDGLDIAGLRMTFCEGALELTTPSADHERAKTLLARLLEHYAFVQDVELHGYGSTTFRKEARERGLEPDECYYFGRDYDAERHPFPDLAIEIVISSGGMDKLSAYAGLQVAEVWMWTPEERPVYVLRGNEYEVASRSRLLPDLDLDLLFSHVWRRNQHMALKDFDAAIRRRPKTTKRRTRKK